MQSLLGADSFTNLLTLDEALSYGKFVGGAPFLNPLRMSWKPEQVNYKWFAAGGTACGYDLTPSLILPYLPYPGVRTVNWPITGLPGNINNGCRDNGDWLSDGAVCHQSAVVKYPGNASILIPSGFSPSDHYDDPSHLFRHAESISFGIPGLGTIGPLMCGDVGNFWLSNPPATSDLFLQLVRFLNGL